MTSARESLTSWLLDPATDRGVHFYDDATWRFRSYAQIAGDVGGVAEQLRDVGARKGDVVCLVLDTGPTFVIAFQAVLAIGAVACVLAPSPVFGDPSEFASHAASLLSQARPVVVVTEDRTLDLVGSAIAAANIDARCLVASDGTLNQGTIAVSERDSDSLLLLQFTSGSTGGPRGIGLSRGNVESNIHAITRWLRIGASDATATWLPIYHDMGLIGCLLTPIANQSDTWIMRPEQFIREPLRWIECFGRLGATLTAAPTFGYAYAAKRLRPEQLDGMSFERWRACIVGAERVDPVALAAFTALLEPHGFRAAALLPAYGLAEATLSVSGLSLDEVPQAIKPDWDTMTFGMPVRVAASARVGDPTIDDGAGWLVSCGTPHMGTSIEIIGEDRRALPPGCLGEIVVRGPSVARGYIRAGSGETTFSRSGVRTGDAGLIMDGSLYVVGRMGDRIKVRGRHRYAEEIESVLTAIPGVPTGRCVVVPGVDRTDRLSLVAIVEASPGDWIARVEAALHREVGGDSLIEVRCVEPGSIPRTSSGKPRRRMLWRQLLDEAATTRPGGNA